MTTEERSRLVKVLSMLGSNHDGERAAAGLLATRLVKSAGTDWDQLLQPQEPCKRQTASDFSPPPMSDMGLCVRNLRRLTHWEQDFVLSLRGQSFLSVGQRRKLAEIAADLRKAGAE